MSGSGTFWRVVADDGPPWGIILPFIALIGLAIGIGLIDARRKPSEESEEALWWITPLLFTVGLFGLLGLFTDHLVSQVDWVITTFSSREGWEVALAYGGLIALSGILLRFEYRRGPSHISHHPDVPILSFLFLPIQVGLAYLMIAFYPWRLIWTLPHYDSPGLLVLAPLYGILWLGKAAIGAGIIWVILKTSFPYFLELREWLPGAVYRRPITAGLLLFWIYAIWSWRIGHV